MPPAERPGASSIAYSNAKPASTISDRPVTFRFCSSVTCPRPETNLHGSIVPLLGEQAIRQAAACICFGGNGEPELWADNLETHLKRKQGHRLAPLATQLQGRLTRLNLGDLGGESMKVLSRIHQLDPTGEAFRYSGHLNSTAYAVDVSRLAATFREAFDIVHGGVLTMLDVHQDFLYERWEYDRMWG